MSTVLVTGGSGFVGGHVILQLLTAGHTVRTTVRSLSREESVRATLRGAGAGAGERLSFVAADLGGDGGWTIGRHARWTKWSDHMPVSIDLSPEF